MRPESKFCNYFTKNTNSLPNLFCMEFTPQHILILDRVDSTNNYAMALIQQGDEDAGKPVFALAQDQGKGRRGRQWKSEPGQNIILSVPVQMQWLPVLQQFRLSVAAALACHDLLHTYLAGRVFIKWPNDIFIDDTKAGGILIENILKGTLWQWAIIGIGININQEDFGETLSGTTSLYKASGKKYPLADLVKELYAHLLKWIRELEAGNFEDMLHRYNDHLYARGQMVKLKKENAVFETRIEGVSPAGALITHDTIERQFVFDEVMFKGKVKE